MMLVTEVDYGWQDAYRSKFHARRKVGKGRPDKFVASAPDPFKVVGGGKRAKGTCTKSENPTDGSRWIVQILSIKIQTTFILIQPTEVGGYFTSLLCLKSPLIHTGLQPGGKDNHIVEKPF
jgi:hypothetical protein